MVVVGRNAFIFESTGKSCNVLPFSEQLSMAKDVSIVDTAIAYDCPLSIQTYVLLARNALYIPELEHNLISPFMMCAGTVEVNDMPKIHCKDATVKDRSINFSLCEIRIPLQLFETFSYFHTQRPEPNELEEYSKVFITLDVPEWNPHCEYFETNERSMLNYEGEMAEQDRKLKLQMEINDTAEDAFLSSLYTMRACDTAIDTAIASFFTAEFSSPTSVCNTIIFVDDFILAVQGSPYRRKVVRRILMNAIDEVLKSPEDLPGATVPISDKKLGQGDGPHNPRKLILGWPIDALKKTLELPLRRQQRILSLLAEFLGRKRCTLLS